MTLMLPPVPGSEDGIKIPEITDEYAKENNIDVLKILLGVNVGPGTQDKVYDFVTSQMKVQKSNYVVSAKYKDDDIYNDYFINLFYIQEGFNQIYEERAQQLFGKCFYNLDRSDEEEKAQYNAVRKGIPGAISIAEKD